MGKAGERDIQGRKQQLGLYQSHNLQECNLFSFTTTGDYKSSQCLLTLRVQTSYITSLHVFLEFPTRDVGYILWDLISPNASPKTKAKTTPSCGHDW